MVQDVFVMVLLAVVVAEIFNMMNVVTSNVVLVLF